VFCAIFLAHNEQMLAMQYPLWVYFATAFTALWLVNVGKLVPRHFLLAKLFYERTFKDKWHCYFISRMLVLSLNLHCQSTERSQSTDPNLWTLPFFVYHQISVRKVVGQFRQAPLPDIH